MRPKVGVGIVATSSRHPQCVLIGKRKGSHGSGSYSLAGGHLEFGESFIDCAKRELMEETGLQLNNCNIETIVNAVDLEDDYHFVVILVKGTIDDNCEPKLMEPDKCEGWFWSKWEEIPYPRFLPVKTAMEQGYHPFHTPCN